MNKAIAYSTDTPDQRSPSGMRDYMSGLSQSAGNFYDNEKSVIKWTLKTYWDTLGREMSSTEWIGVTTPQVVNAFNLLSKNSVRIDLGFLNKQNSNSCFFFFFLDCCQCRFCTKTKLRSRIPRLSQLWWYWTDACSRILG